MFGILLSLLIISSIVMVICVSKAASADLNDLETYDEINRPSRNNHFSFVDARQEASSALTCAMWGWFLVPFLFLALVKISLARSLVSKVDLNLLRHLETAKWVAGVGIFVWVCGIVVMMINWEVLG